MVMRAALLAVAISAADADDPFAQEPDERMMTVDRPQLP
jgi:hypothetical protein